MNEPQIIPDIIRVRLHALASSLIGEPFLALTDIERQVFYLCRDMGMVYADFGPNGEDPGVVREATERAERRPDQSLEDECDRVMDRLSEAVEARSEPTKS